MHVRFKKHYTVNGVSAMQGSTLDLSVLDKVLEDGRVVYHHPQKNTYDILPEDVVTLVYDSPTEMEREKAANAARAAVVKEQKRIGY